MNAIERGVVQAELSDRVAGIARRWKGVPGMVSGALQEVQEAYGYLPEAGFDTLARELDVPLSQLFSVATFYSFFRLTPRGNHHLQVCEGTACHVLGAEGVREKLVRDLRIDDRGLSEDQRFSVESVRCLGCCSMAPVVRIDAQTVGRVRQKDVDRLLRPYRKQGAAGEDQ